MLVRASCRSDAGSRGRLAQSVGLLQPSIRRRVVPQVLWASSQFLITWGESQDMLYLAYILRVPTTACQVSDPT